LSSFRTGSASTYRYLCVYHKINVETCTFEIECNCSASYIRCAERLILPVINECIKDSVFYSRFCVTKVPKMQFPACHGYGTEVCSGVEMIVRRQ